MRRLRTHRKPRLRQRRRWRCRCQRPQRQILEQRRWLATLQPHRQLQGQQSHHKQPIQRPPSLSGWQRVCRSVFPALPRIPRRNPGHNQRQYHKLWWCRHSGRLGCWRNCRLLHHRHGQGLTFSLLTSCRWISRRILSNYLYELLHCICQRSQRCRRFAGRSCLLAIPFERIRESSR